MALSQAKLRVARTCVVVLLQGLDIAITPHLDDGLEYGGWRNALWFDPLQKYGGFSYYEVSVPCMGSALRCASSGKACRAWAVRAPHLNPLLSCTPPAPVQVMLKPIAQALNAVIEPTTQVWFAMQGACWGRAVCCSTRSLHADAQLVGLLASCSSAPLFQSCMHACACVLPRAQER
jgi:hypothetical protein